MPCKADRLMSTRRADEFLACAPEFVLSCGNNALMQMARHLGLSASGMRNHIPSHEELLRQLCQRHLNEAFEAVCLPSDWQGFPADVLRAMGLALLDYARENAARHTVFLLLRHTLSHPARSAHDTLLAYLTNNFQLALQAVQPEKPFSALENQARILFGQVMHLPLWWPAEPEIGQDEWLCHQIGQVTANAPPDWRLPAAEKVKDSSIAF